MAADAPTIAETINEIQAALRDYIEATYHVGHPTIIEQRAVAPRREGMLFKAPFIESTPRYHDEPARSPTSTSTPPSMSCSAC